MAVVNIVSQTDSSKIAGVWGNGSLRTQSGYSYVVIGSASATGVIAATSGVLHNITITDSATATTILQLTDSASVALQVGDNSASAVAILGTLTKNTFLYDAIFNNGLCYRLSGSANPITITYTTGAFTA